MYDLNYSYCRTEQVDLPPIDHLNFLSTFELQFLLLSCVDTCHLHLLLLLSRASMNTDQIADHPQSEKEQWNSTACCLQWSWRIYLWYCEENSTINTLKETIMLIEAKPTWTSKGEHGPKLITLWVSLTKYQNIAVTNMATKTNTVRKTAVTTVGEYWN
jgi:hypothetical protein